MTISVGKLIKASAVASGGRQTFEQSDEVYALQSALEAGIISRVATFSALPSTPSDLVTYRVTTLGYNVIWDSDVSAWTTESGAVVTSADEA